jgi:YesN/AraC family two-component response regulator
VDDDPTICSMLSDTIAIYLPQARIVPAFSADEAFTYLSQKHFDLLLTDNIMPGMQGIDMVESIKDKYPNTKIVMMTAFNPVTLQKRLDQLGDIHLLKKPFGLADLIEALQPDW